MKFTAPTTPEDSETAFTLTGNMTLSKKMSSVRKSQSAEKSKKSSMLAIRFGSAKN